ncbi:MAG: signal recognition particle protein, partial [Solobacterium sp.]|nr:signal recognition particle protein [Solobacterium sp.]
AIIQSMTKEERENPDRIRSTMKRRIAKGSGTTVTDVNRLLSQFEKTRKAMGMMGRMAESGQLSEEKLKEMTDHLQEQAELAQRNTRNRFRR